MVQVRLSDLGMDSFQIHAAWKVLEGSYEENELILTPADKNNKGLISNKNGEVWCLSKMIFYNKEQHAAASLNRGDSNAAPMLWSVWKNHKFINLILPPAPDFVLEKEGPARFCEEFNLRPKDVFPITLLVVPGFQLEPLKRSILIHPDGTVSQV